MFQQNSDTLNQATMRSSESVEFYSELSVLYPAEAIAVSVFAAEVNGAAILDLGVGAGRSVLPLMEISKDYVGVDFSPEMIAFCRKRYPSVRFEVADARDLSQLPSGSFGLVVFTCNGICMVNHEGRLKILNEVLRLLRPGGGFVFSTFNQNSDQHNSPKRWPDFSPSRNPFRLGMRILRYLRDVGLGTYNHQRYKKLEYRTEDYSIINDKYHNCATMQYYISLEKQRQQLVQAGFEPGTTAFDGQGKLIEDDSVNFMFTFAARKPSDGQ